MFTTPGARGHRKIDILVWGGIVTGGVVTTFSEAREEGATLARVAADLIGQAIDLHCTMTDSPTGALRTFCTSTEEDTNPQIRLHRPPLILTSSTGGSNSPVPSTRLSLAIPSPVLSPPDLGSRAHSQPLRSPPPLRLQTSLLRDEASWHEPMRGAEDAPKVAALRKRRNRSVDSSTSGRRDLLRRATSEGAGDGLRLESSEGAEASPPAHLSDELERAALPALRQGRTKPDAKRPSHMEPMRGDAVDHG